MPLTNGNPAAEATARGAKPDVDNTPRSNKALRRAQQARETIAILAEWFPACFAVYEGRRRPLKLGIDHDITATLAAAITRQELSHALRTYCGNGGYLRASRTGT